MMQLERPAAQTPPTDVSPRAAELASEPVRLFLSVSIEMLLLLLPLF